MIQNEAETHCEQQGGMLAPVETEYIKKALIQAITGWYTRSLSEKNWGTIDGITLSTCEYNFNTWGQHNTIFLKKTGVTTCVVYSN